MQTTAIVVGVYGVLVLVGGVIGFAKAGSKPSLVAGVGFGLALLMASGLIGQGRRPAVAGAAILAAVLLVLMGVRFARTRKFMPAGLVALLSAVTLVWLLAALGR